MPSNVMQKTDFQEFFALGITQVFEDRLKQQEKTYSRWLREESVKRWKDTEQSVSGLGQMPEKNLGEVFSVDTISKGTQKDYELVAWGLAVTIEYEAMEWEIHGIFKGLGQELAKSAANRFIVTAYSLLNKAFSAAGDTNYQTFQSEDIIDTAHTAIGGGTWSNRLTTNPGLAYLSIQDLIINMSRLTNERGFYDPAMPKTLATSVDNRFLAAEILESSARPDQANPGVQNRLKGEGIQVHTSPYVTSATAWFLMGDKRDTRIKLRVGNLPTLRRDSDMRSLNLVMSCYTSFYLAVFDSRGWAGSDGTGV